MGEFAVDDAGDVELSGSRGVGGLTARGKVTYGALGLDLPVASSGIQYNEPVLSTPAASWLRSMTF